MSQRGDLPDDFAFRLDGTLVPLVEVAEWATPKRACCPCLTFEIKAPCTIRGMPGIPLTLAIPVHFRHHQIHQLQARLTATRCSIAENR